VTPADVDAVAHVFVDALDDRIVVDGPDGHHLQRVRRLASGERVTAADGTGAWRLYNVAATTAGRVELAASGDRLFVPAPAVSLVLAVALTKGGIDAVVTAATELGVATIVPVLTARTVVKWEGARAERGVDRLQALAREAAMQSRRARPALLDPVTALETVAARGDLVVADRTGCRADELPTPTTGSWAVLVGPEGGFAPDERERLAERPHLRLGDHVLRAATAPIAALTILGDRIAQMGHA
jgi:16S rRNA (uracil1498-N3)-methyltransferase